MNYVLRGLHIFNHIAFVYFLIYIQNFWLLLLSFLVFQFIIVVGISGGLHRYLTHKSFKTSKFWESVMLYTSIFATVGTPLGWVGTHRLHHAYSDTEKDPHSPFSIGFLKSYLHIWNKFTIPSNVVKDIISNKTAMTIHKRYLEILLVSVFLLYIVNPVLGMVIYSIPAMLMFHSTAITNSINHKFGYRNFNTNDSSTNLMLPGWLLAGEGWHNNHHKNPSSPTFSSKWSEFDLTWHFIKLIRKQ